MWSTLRARPVHTAVLLTAMIVLVAHQWMHRAFVIDDAAISFAFARNIANGDGIVPWPGGERIESFSNPTWVVLLTLLDWLGFDGFVSAKPLAALVGVLTVPVVWSIARRAMPDDPDGPAALFAPVTLALSAQLAIWSASGLENSLWSLCLAVAIERTAADRASGRYVGSALGWLLVVWTRPEGALYAAMGGLYFAADVWRREGPRGWPLVVGWGLALGVPTIAIESLRIWYFAWPLPNTYYAKLVVRETYPFWWNSRGWAQLREFAGRLWHGWFLPVYLLAVVGRPRARVVLASAFVLLVLPPPDWLCAMVGIPKAPEWWLTGRLVVLSLGAIGLPLVADRDAPGFLARAICWSSAVITALFSAYADGDWMGAYRWMSLMVVPLSVLFAVGARDVVAYVERHLAFDDARPGEQGWSTAGWLAAALMLGAWVPPNLNQSKDHVYYNYDETAFRIMERSRFTDSIRRKTFTEDRVVNVEMDQGGNIWEHPDYLQIDMASLVDIPMARHTYTQRPFIEEYVFREHTPTFAHVHGWWGDFSNFKSYPQWGDMFPLPQNYEAGPGRPPHDGMWANRGLLFDRRWKGVDRAVQFGDVTVHGVTVPADAWPAGGEGYLEIGVSSPPRQRGSDVRLLVFLYGEDGAIQQTWALGLGYGLLSMDKWRANEVFVGRYALPVRRDVPAGRYSIGVVVLGPKSTIWTPTTTALPAGVAVGVAGDARYAIGEIRYDETVQVTSLDEVRRQAVDARKHAIELAAANRCAEAEQEWIRAKRYRPRAWFVHDREEALVETPIADCWAERAKAEPTRAAKWLAKAHEWDPRSPALERVGGPIGDRLWAEGVAARAAGDAEVAYRAFSDLLSFQPWRSWARRYAEEARDQRLGLVPTEQVRTGGAIPEGGEN